jgi:hypothetical protein
LHAELKESNEQGAEIEATESTASEVQEDIGGTFFFLPFLCLVDL